jgi:hypothetical protein
VPSLIAFYRIEDCVEVFSKDPVYSLLGQLTECKPAQGIVPAGNDLGERWSVVVLVCRQGAGVRKA